MEQSTLVGLASILVLGIGAQWIAWRLRLPSILFLLISGFIAGPILGLFDPDTLLGESLFPGVSLAVGIILFEGGLSLHLDELREVGKSVRRLISVGVLVTWVVCAAAAYFILGLDLALATLLGAILVVSGPTVVIPLLRHVRPTNRLASTLKWEGILIDPVGATLAVLVFEAILHGDFSGSASLPIAGNIALTLVITLVIGCVVGAAGAGLIVLSLYRNWVPTYLQTAFALAVVLAAFAVSNGLQAESGLMAVTLMGVLVANQKWVNVKHIIHFDEELGLLLLSALFVVLAARLERDFISAIGLPHLLFLGVILFVGRPLSAVISTLGSSLTWRERIFVAWLAPRGIVAASVASIFALELSGAGYPGADRLVSLTFLVVVGTVAVYAVTATPVASWLGVRQKNPQGILILGAQDWARQIGHSLQKAGFDVVMVDSNHSNVRAAKRLGLEVVEGNVLSDDVLNELPLERLGKLLALTSNSELNALAALRYGEEFGEDHVYQLASGVEHEGEFVDKELRGHILFQTDLDYRTIRGLFSRRATVIHTPITDKFSLADFQALYGDRAIPLFVIDGEAHLDVISADEAVEVAPGETLISLVLPEQTQPQPTAAPTTEIER